MSINNIKLSRQDYDHESFIIGLSLAISSSVFIGSSFIIKKMALIKTNESGKIRASAGGYTYLKQWMWWLGLITMGIGEAANLLAYAFAPASLVTPLGALSVLVAAILSSKFLNEKLSFIGKVAIIVLVLIHPCTKLHPYYPQLFIGCFLCIVGSIIFVVNSPKTEEIKKFSDLCDKLTDYVFLTYVLIILVMTLILKVIFIPKFGQTNVVVYLLICSAIGSLTVVFCKGVALGIRESFRKEVNNFSSYIFWLILLLSIICIIIQMNYLNRALDLFHTSIVTPVYYVMFTVLVIIASGILYREWEHMESDNILGCICGFIVLIFAVFTLNAFKGLSFTLNDLNLNSRRYLSKQCNDAEDLENLLFAT